MNPLTPIAEAEFVAFDLETTGLHPVSAQIVELGAVRFKGDGEVLGQFQQLVDPKSKIPHIATQIHGITNAMVQGLPTIAVALPKFLEFLGDAPIVMLAHNASFDLGFLSAALCRLRHPSPVHQTLDTCTLARRRISLSRYNLEALGRHLGLIAVERHRALDDSLLLKDVFAHLIARPPALRRVEDLFKISAPRGMDRFGLALEHAPKGYEDLFAAIASGSAIELQYAGGSRPGELRRVTLQGVLQIKGEIYLAVYCHQGRSDKTFRLDRIESYRVLPSNK